MNDVLEKLVAKATDAKDLAKEMAESGMRHVGTALKGIPVFGSLAALSSEDADRDETHYLLVPFADSDSSYVVYSKRVLPAGVGVTNSLPKARVFHLPDASGKAVLERELIDRALAGGEISDQSDLADRLEGLADAVDRETEKVSGGLLLVGSVVAIVNPLLGIGIAAKGLLPSLGSKATKAGASLIGDKLRAWTRSREEAGEEKRARDEVRKLKPEIFENPLIRSLDALVTNASEGYDPMFDEENWVDAFEVHRQLAVTVEAVGEVYEEVLAGKAKGTKVSAETLAWVRHLAELRV